MSRSMIVRMLILARLSLADSNSGIPFAVSKAQAMRDINFWRNQLRVVGV
jgi:hypothetical protein